MSDELGEAWDALDHDLRWSSGFFVDYVFVAQPRQAHALVAKLREHVDPSTFVAFEAEQAAHLHGFAAELPVLLDAWSRPVELHERPLLAYVGTLEFEAEAGQPWRRGFADLLGRLNERRERLRERLRGLIIVAPVQSKPALRSIAPDLWSIHSHVLELPRTEPCLPAPPSPAPPATQGNQSAPRLPTTPTEALVLLRQASRRSPSERLPASMIDPLRSQLAHLGSEGADLRMREELLDAWLDQVEHMAGRDPDEAQRWLDGIPELRVEAGPTSPRACWLALRARVLAAELALLRGHREEAARQLDAALAVERAGFTNSASPLRERIELALARLARARGDRRTAASHCELALALRRSTTILRERAELHIEMGELEPAIVLLGELADASRAAPRERARALHDLAHILRLAGHWPAARARLDDALALVLDDPLLESDLRVELGRWFSGVGDEPRARRELLRATELRSGAL